MKLQRFFVEEGLDINKEITIKDVELVHQVVKVFRKQSGDQIILLDNSGFEFLSEITSLSKKEFTVLVKDKKEVKNIAKKEITIFASLIKKDKFEWVLEKCTELGVSHFVPVISERSEKKDLNIERAKKILKEASEQSERGIIPTICEPISLSEAVKIAGPEVFVLDLKAVEFDSDKLKAKTYKLFIGPEGGWGEKDIALFKEKNIPSFSLGNQVLRAETASMAVVAKILL